MSSPGLFWYGGWRTVFLKGCDIMALPRMTTFRAKDVLVALAAIASLGVVPASIQAQNPPAPGQANAPAQPAAPPAQVPSIRPNYVLGANDQVLLRAPQVEEINERPFRIDTDGFITLPLVGRVRASGLTVQALETDVTDRLRQFVREPQVLITVVQFHSEPVFVNGEFRVPGIYPLEGRTLVEMLASVGGTLPDASRRIKITRRAEYGPIPLPGAIEDPERKGSSVEVSIAALSENVNPAEDLVLKPYDIVSVERAGRIYVTGEVGRPGAIELNSRDSVSITQALAEAGGFSVNAVRTKARVLRQVTGTSRRAEIDIDLKRVFEGKDTDFPLLANDALFIPRANVRAAMAPIATSMIAGIPYIIVTAILAP
jgi:polysaccharide biosynthesis/export protein